MQRFFSFQNDPCKKLISEQHIKKIYHFPQEVKCFPFQTTFSQNPRSKELIHHTNQILIQPNRKPIVYATVLVQFVANKKITLFTCSSPYQGLLGVDSSCWQVPRSVRHSIKGNGTVVQSPT